MNTVSEQTINHYLTEYSRVAKQLAGHHLPWLQQIKQTELDNFAAQGFPTIKQEDWKYTNLTSITKQGFQIALPEQDLSTINITHFLPDASAQHYLVFVNGVFAPTLSADNKPGNGVTIANLAQALADDNTQIKTYLNKLASQAPHAFKQLNTVFMQDGAFIYLAANQQLNQPVHLLFIQTETAGANMNALRNLIIAEENSQATIIENYISLGQSKYFTNTLTEVFLDKQAQLSHYKLQQENQQAFHIGTLEVQQQARSHFTSHVFTLGGALVRSDINIGLAAEQSYCALNGLYLASGRQHMDHHTCVNHQMPQGASREYYKGILTDRARAVFNGKVWVAPGAYKTDAQQTNKNLLLSSEAEIDTKPQLEIYADDVQCTHGAAVGQLSADALFYLRARGINEAQARSLLIYAFIQELFVKIPELSLRQYLQHSLNHFLPAQITLEEMS